MPGKIVSSGKKPLPPIRVRPLAVLSSFFRLFPKITAIAEIYKWDTNMVLMLIPTLRIKQTVRYFAASDRLVFSSFTF